MYDELLKKTEASELLRVSVRKIDQMRKDGELPFLKIGKQVRFRRSTLLEWIENQESGKGAA